MDPYSFLLIVVVFVAVFWLMSRGQKKQQKRAQEQMAQLEPGSWVMTTTGFYGRLIDIDGDVAILETADGTETYWLRAAVRGAQEPPFGTPMDDSDVGDPRNSGEENSDNDESSHPEKNEEVLTHDESEKPLSDAHIVDDTKPGEETPLLAENTDEEDDNRPRPQENA